MKYRVYGHTTVVITVEIEAKNIQEAYAKAKKQREYLDEASPMLVGVTKKTETVFASEPIEFDDIEEIY